MNKNLDSTFIGWQRGQKQNIKTRGNAALVIAQIKNGDIHFAGQNATTRCQWPLITKTSDPRFQSRRVY